MNCFKWTCLGESGTQNEDNEGNYLLTRRIPWNKYCASFKNEAAQEVETHNSSSVKSYGCGYLKFGVSYSSTENELSLTILGANDLPHSEKGDLNPYLCIHVLPDRKIKFKTSVKRKSMNPYWNENFVIELDKKSNDKMSLQFQICNQLMYKKHTIIGELLHNLYLVDVLQGRIYNEAFRPCFFSRNDDTGEILTRIKYISSLNLLQVMILEARNITGAHLRVLSNYHVCLSLFHCDDLKMVDTKQSSLVSGSQYFQFNETFVFQVPQSDLCKHLLNIELRVDKGTNSLLGYSKISFSDTNKTVLVNEIIPEIMKGETVEKWIELQSVDEFPIFN